MRIRRLLVVCLFLLATLSSLDILNSSIKSVHAQGTMITLGQPVTGTLSRGSPEDWWGVNIPRGVVNMTLTVPHGNSADLAFSFSPFLAGTPMGVTNPSVANIIHNGVGGNQTYQFVAPGTDPLLSLPFLVPGPTAIRIYSPSSNYGRSGSVAYTLTVVSVQQFAALTVGTLNSFNNVRAGTPVLYSFNAPQMGAYNVTMKANATAPMLWFSLTAYEGDFYLPLSSNNLNLGQSSLLLVLSSTFTTYLEVTPYLNPSPSTKPLKGNVTVSYMPLPTISQGQLITGTFSGTPTFYLAANLGAGNYYNFTLTPSGSMTGRLDIYSPSWPMGYDVASSALPGNGVVQRVRNLAIFYYSSYGYSNATVYRPVTQMASGPRPDRVLVRVSGVGTGSYTLALDAASFPQLLPNTPVNLKLSTTKGPYYAFYQAQSGPGGYTETFPYTVSNSSVSWASEVDLDGVYKGVAGIGGTFDPEILLRISASFLVGPASLNDVASWMTVAERNFIYNSNFSAENTTIQIGFGTSYSLTPYIGATIGSSYSGNSTIRGPLSYSFKTLMSVGVGAPTTDFLSGVNVNMYSVSLSAGTTYKVAVAHSSASEVWEVFDPTNLQTIPSMGPFLIPGISTDPNQASTADYFYFTAPATRTYYLAAGMNPGPLGGPIPAGLPEDQYSFTVSVVTSPPAVSTTQLSVMITAPSQTTLGQALKINGTVTNAGSYNANNVIVTITLPGGLTTSQPLSATIGTLAPGQSASFSWTLTASGPGAVSTAITTSSDNAPQTVKTSAITISSTNPPGSPSSSFFSSTTGVALLTGLLAGIAAFVTGMVVGRKRRQKPAGIGREPSSQAAVPSGYDQLFLIGSRPGASRFFSSKVLGRVD